MTCHYDESLAVLLATVAGELGDVALERGRVLREAAGRLTFVHDGELDPGRANGLSARLRELLGPYARPDRVLVTRDSPGAERLLSEQPQQWLNYSGRQVRYLDRRVVGVDWLGFPAPTGQTPPRLVYGSVKGGVGRSTALAVTAAELASQGTNVLVVDLDLEAPGIGAMLLPEDRLPRFGAIDYLSERCVSTTGDTLGEILGSLVGTSPLTGPAGGRVDVVPAAGSATLPENYLGKLSRALLDVGPDGTSLPLHKKMSELVETVAHRATYDVVLLDARAGLAELTATAFLHLGAGLLLFGTAHRQSVQDYRFLFAHLATLVAPGQPSPWQDIKMVQAKTTADEALNRWFREELAGLFTDFLYEESETLEGFNFDIDDPEAPHFPVPVALNPLFADFDPTRRSTDLTRPFYEATFRPLCEEIRRQLGT